TIHTMLALEERLGKQVQFVATLHDDHSPHRHIHSLVLVQGARLNREDFKALRLEATERALSQRRMRDRIRGHHLGNYRSRTNRNISRQRQSTIRRLSGGSRPYQSYTCPLCHYHQALLASNRGYRCPACGLYLRRDRSSEVSITKRREVGLAAGFSP